MFQAISDYSNGSYYAVIAYCGAVYHAWQGASNYCLGVISNFCIKKRKYFQALTPCSVD